MAVLARSFPEVEDVIYDLLRNGETDVKIKLKDRLRTRILRGDPR